MTPKKPALTACSWPKLSAPCPARALPDSFFQQDAQALAKALLGKVIRHRHGDLWRRRGQAAAGHEIVWHWVRGHDGNPGNERADELAREGMAPFKR